VKLSRDFGQKKVALLLTYSEAKALANALFGYLMIYESLGRTKSVDVAGKIKDYIIEEFKK